MQGPRSDDLQAVRHHLEHESCSQCHGGRAAQPRDTTDSAVRPHVRGDARIEVGGHASSCVVGFDRGDWRLWRESLIKRLSLRRKRVSGLLEGYNSDEEDGERTIKYLPSENPGADSGAILDQDGVTFDSTVVHKACKIKGLRCRLTIELKAGDGEGLVVKVMELRPAKQTKYVFTRERLIELWELEDTDLHPARPVFTVLGNKDTREEGIQKLVDGLTRDKESGEVLLRAVSNELRRRNGRARL